MKAVDGLDVRVVDLIVQHINLHKSIYVKRSVSRLLFTVHCNTYTAKRMYAQEYAPEKYLVKVQDDGSTWTHIAHAPK